MEIKTLFLPMHMFTRATRDEQEDSDVISSLQGNPDGLSVSSIPYIYCVTEQHHRRIPLYNLKVTFRWPPSAKIIDETQSQEKKALYEDYSLAGYVGVLRNFEDSKRYVMFRPRDYVVNIENLDSGEIVYRNDALADETNLGVPGVNLQLVRETLLHEGLMDEQKEVNELMLSHIGPKYIDLRRDYFDVFSIARRKNIPVARAKAAICKIIRKVMVNKSSGCWVSATSGVYTKTFWASKGGLSFSDVFHFPQDLAAGTGQPVVIKNKHILHAPICELTLGADHTRCCRPQHLKLGTSRENCIHVKVRKSLDQLFDLNYDEMQQYAHHVLCLSDLIQRQVHIMTREELRVQERRRGNRILQCEDLQTGERWVTVNGDPDMGEAHGEEEEEEEKNGDRQVYDDEAYDIIKREEEGEEGEEEEKEEAEKDGNVFDDDLCLNSLFESDEKVKRIYVDHLKAEKY